ncbi:MAG TPA: TIGR03086 family metal-binding protein [Actinomycetes bacterium]|nr:TIGR03086 family metal-binding protein [Actinomycetes bacterium]
MDAISLIPASAYAVSDRVHQIKDDQWDEDTPCEEWTVRDLVNHLVYEQLWAPHLLRGETIQQVGDRYEGDVLGDDPVGAWDNAMDDALAAWAEVDAEQTVHLSFGDFPASAYADQVLCDLVVHGWDLSRGADLDDDMDPDGVAHSLAFAEANAETLTGSGMFGTPQKPRSDAAQDRLLALLGRRA